MSCSFAFPYTEVLALVARVPSSLSAPPCSAGDRLLFAHPLSLLCLQAVVSVLTGRVPICLLSVSFTGIEAHEVRDSLFSQVLLWEGV